ncbi:dimethylarginine dimethylaminohydrolase family protein [Streptomyces sp. NPDC086796]|uniref:dimethylarginine dimethylaminohydrolase family protein n=1 Tax=unclassified Streptomyces TaxID=2593676 RepID=UPI00339A3564
MGDIVAKGVCESAEIRRSAVSEVYVESEFAPLRTVVLARSEVSIPASAMSSDDLRFLSAESRKEIAVGGDMKDFAPERQARWEGEREAFRTVLERHGIQVHRPRPLTPVEKATAGDGYANFFARDPFFTVGNQVVEASMRLLHRRREVLPLREVMRDHVYPSDCGYVAVPMPEVAAPDDPTLGPGPFLEGGDVLVLGKKVFVGTSGLASNPLGIQWLAKFLAPYGYTVEKVRLHRRILHLDCALGFIREGLLVACEEALLDGIPDPLKEWERITVDLDQATSLATNGLPLGPDVYVTDPEFSFLGREIEKFGVHVEYVDFSITRSLGGSFRCSTQPLLRKF